LPTGPGWDRQRNSWEAIQRKFGIQHDRYSEFNYLLYLDIDNPWIIDYVDFHLHGKMPKFVNRISSNIDFWKTLTDKQWFLDIIQHGIKIPFDTVPPPIRLRNNKRALDGKYRMGPEYHKRICRL
jgi:hypothetical protein